MIITAPRSGVEFWGPVATIELEAHACDIDGTVVTVEFYADGDKIGADNNGSDGWGIVWSCSTMGAYEVTAKATDNRGGTTTSPAIEVIAALLGPRR